MLERQKQAREKKEQERLEKLREDEQRKKEEEAKLAEFRKKKEQALKEFEREDMLKYHFFFCLQSKEDVPRTARQIFGRRKTKKR